MAGLFWRMKELFSNRQMKILEKAGEKRLSKILLLGHFADIVQQNSGPFYA